MVKSISTNDAASDLLITPHINDAALPAMIRPVLSLAQSPAEKDMLLMSLLTASGCCMPNLYFRYGVAAKRYYPNLQCFIVGSAASGKGIANLALDLVRPIDECTPLLIAGDATYPSFYKQLAKQGGRGYIHESEGSVITDIWRSSTANYNTALRKAAEHEPISRSRCREASVIPCPQLSVLLTGTFSQYRALVRSIENGYFSRLLTLIVDDCRPFSSRYVTPMEHSEGVLSAAAQQLYHLYEQLLFAKPREFCLTDEQRERLGHHFESAYPTLIRMLGKNFHSVVLRMAIQIERIAMILSAMRLELKVESRMHPTAQACGDSGQSKACGGDKNITEMQNILLCTNEDYQTAEMIGNKLLLHIAQAYQMIEGHEQQTMPEVKSLDQKQILLSLLPDEFESRQLTAEAKAQGVTERTAFRWNDEWQQTGIVLKVKHGVYKKRDACA